MTDQKPVKGPAMAPHEAAGTVTGAQSLIKSLESAGAENIFGIPGFGQYFVTSIAARDYPVILGCTVFASFLVMASNLIVDVVYPVLDPRVKL